MRTMSWVALGPWLFLAMDVKAIRSDEGLAKPNIVLILADDLGYGDLGCYGQQKIKTPNIDALARQGMRFTQAYAGSTVCAPSRCALMTGRHTGHSRVRGNALVPLEPEDRTMAEILREAGYRTALFGKWGLGEPDSTGLPNRQGFDEFFGYLNQHHAHNYYPDYLWSNEKKVALPGNKIGAADNVAVEKGTYSHDLILSKADEFLARQGGQPFFLYLALTVPHANNEASRATGNGMEVPDLGEYADRDWPETEKAKAAMIARLDDAVGLVMRRLAERGLDQNTLVLFTSDNGPHREGGKDFDPEFFDSNGPLRGIKRDLYEGGIRVPTIARWPGVVEPGTESDAIWAFWDLPVTVAELAGVDASEVGETDGVSIFPALRGKALENRPPLYWEFHEGQASKQAVRLGDWKAVRLWPGDSIELYNVVDDPGETKNVAEHHPDVVDKLRAIIESSRTPSEQWPLKDGRPGGRRDTSG